MTVSDNVMKSEVLGVFLKIWERFLIKLVRN